MLADPEKDAVHTEHLALALYEPSNGSVRAICDEAGLSDADLYRAVDVSGERTSPRSAPVSGAVTEFAAHSRHVALALTAALRLADDHGVADVGTRYLLYGLVAVPGCHIADALIRARLSPEVVEAWIMKAARQLIPVTSADTAPRPGGHAVQKGLTGSPRRTTSRCSSPSCSPDRRCHRSPSGCSASGVAVRASSWR